MPSNLVKTPEDHENWQRAKAAVRKQYPDIPEGDERFYKLTTAIFEKMGGSTTKARPSFFRRALRQMFAKTNTPTAHGTLGGPQPGDIAYPTPPRPRPAPRRIGWLHVPMALLKAEGDRGGPGSQGGKGYWNDRGHWEYGERPAEMRSLQPHLVAAIHRDGTARHTIVLGHDHDDALGDARALLESSGHKVLSVHPLSHEEFQRHEASNKKPAKAPEQPKVAASQSASTVPASSAAAKPVAADAAKKLPVHGAAAGFAGPAGRRTHRAERQTPQWAPLPTSEESFRDAAEHLRFTPVPGDPDHVTFEPISKRGRKFADEFVLDAGQKINRREAVEHAKYFNREIDANPDAWKSRLFTVTPTGHILVKADTPEEKAELIREHQHLVKVLRSASHADDKAEAKKQAAELAAYRADTEDDEEGDDDDADERKPRAAKPQAA